MCLLIFFSLINFPHLGHIGIGDPPNSDQDLRPTLAQAKPTQNSTASRLYELSRECVTACECVLFFSLISPNREPAPNVSCRWDHSRHSKIQTASFLLQVCKACIQFPSIHLHAQFLLFFDPRFVQE